MSTEEKKAAMLMAFGGIDSTENLEPFLKNILKGRPISPAMLQKTQERYERIGGKSPLLEITRAQAAEIEKRLAEMGSPQKVYVGMRFWHPYIRETIDEMVKDGITRVTSVIMTPFTSPVATGGYEDDIDEARDANDGRPRVDIVSNWHLHPEFLDAVIDNIKEALGDDDPKEFLVIFSNHSLPRDALEGDAYEMKINQTVAALVERFPVDYKTAYQSQGGSHVVWLGPATEEVMEGAVRSGKKGVVVVPLGFVSDHIETLYDIDIMYKNLADSLGLVYKRSASLNTSPRFMDLLASLIKTQSERF
jgi:ferrochelatase